MNTPENPPAVLTALLNIPWFNDMWTEWTEQDRIEMVSVLRNHTGECVPQEIERRHFAGLAMQGMLANPQFYGTSIGRQAVEHAEALIKELNKSK